MNINKVLNTGNLTTNKNITTNKNSQVPFSDYLKNALNNVNDLQVKADDSNKLLATGQVDNIHQVMIANEKAEIAMQFTLGVRNKVLDAYNEIMRMQI